MKLSVYRRVTYFLPHTETCNPRTIVCTVCIYFSLWEQKEVISKLSLGTVVCTECTFSMQREATVLTVTAPCNWKFGEHISNAGILQIFEEIRAFVFSEWKNQFLVATMESGLVLSYGFSSCIKDLEFPKGFCSLGNGLLAQVS